MKSKLESALPYIFVVFGAAMLAYGAYGCDTVDCCAEHQPCGKMHPDYCPGLYPPAEEEDVVPPSPEPEVCANHPIILPCACEDIVKDELDDDDKDEIRQRPGVRFACDCSAITPNGRSRCKCWRIDK